MSIDFPNSPSNGDTYSYSGETYRYNGVAWVRVRDRVTTFNGATGAIEGVSSVNGETGDVTISVSGSDGVTSFAGFTGPVASGITTNQIIFHSGTGISGSTNFTFDGTDVSLTTDGVIDTNDGGHHGRVVKSIRADEALSPNDPVYITGSVGASGRVTVAKADASDPAKMPAAGVVFSSFTTNQEGYMTVFGPVRSVDTSAFSANDTIYVSPGTGITASRPTASSDLVQNIGRAGRINASNGTLIIGGAGRNNDVPNLLHARAGISCDAGGITFADGTFLSSEAQIAFKNEQNTFTQTNFITSGEGFGTDGDAEQSIKFQDNFLVTIGDVGDAANSTKITIDDDDGLVTISPSLAVDTSVQHAGDSNTKMQFLTDRIDFDAGGREGMRLTATETQFNDGIRITSAGVTFADGTFQKTAAKTGYRYVIDTTGLAALSSTPSAGTIDVAQQYAGVIDKISIHDTDADGNDISSLLSIFADAGGYLQVMTADNLELFVAHISAADLDDSQLTHTFGSDVFVLQHNNDGIEMIGLDTFDSGDEVFVTIVPASSAVAGITDLTRGTTNALTSFMFLDGSPVNSGGLSAGLHSNFNRLFIDDEVKLNLKGVTLGTGHLGFNDGTLQQTATKDVGTFTVSASSAISTGAKTDALHRIPYNATLTKFELKSKATGGMTAAVYIAGGDFGDPTSGFVTGATAETTGLTGETTTFGTASVNEGDFVYLHVLANASGATAAQAFVSYETRA